VSSDFHYRITPTALKRILNIYGPYLGAGIRVEYISKDWKQIRVSMKLRWYNRNIVGVHFGGSLYSMVDPHLMLMLMRLLGDSYLVWDKSASIEFIRPGTGRVRASFEITDAELEGIREQVDLHRKYLPEFSVVVVDEKDKVVARIRKVLYVRRNRQTSAVPDTP
jgi:acyl-coenzyme A thioesterase PaaI-like protein